MTSKQGDIAATDVRGPIRVALSEDHVIVRAGLISMLVAHPEVEVVDPPDWVGDGADIVLLDPFLQLLGQSEMRSVPATSSTTKTILYTWERDPRMLAAAFGYGYVNDKVHGYLFKGTSVAAFVSSIISTHRGPQAPLAVGARLIGTDGLTGREAEVLCLVARGLSNEEIAVALFVSVNSIKSCIRLCYRRIGVENRTQAIIWALDETRSGPPSPHASTARTC